MTVRSIKYKKTFSAFTLYLYLTFLIVAVFHYHPYETNNTVTISSSIPGENKNVKYPFLDDQSNCRLEQFAHSNYSNTTIDIDYLCAVPLTEKNVTTEREQFTKSFKYNSNQLRAPPLS